MENLKFMGTVFGQRLFIEIDKESEISPEFQALRVAKYLKELWEKQDKEELKLI